MTLRWPVWGTRLWGTDAEVPKECWDPVGNTRPLSELDYCKAVSKWLLDRTWHIGADPTGDQSITLTNSIIFSFEEYNGVMVKGTGDRQTKRADPSTLHWATVWPPASYLTPLSFRLFMDEMVKVIATPIIWKLTFKRENPYTSQCLVYNKPSLWAICARYQFI